MDLLARRMAMVRRGGGRVLPEGYQQVEWIQGDGLSYIDTGISASAKSEMLVKYIVQANYSGNWSIICGNRSGSVYWNIQSSAQSGFIRFNSANAAGTGTAGFFQQNVSLKEGDEVEAFLINRNEPGSYFIVNGAQYLPSQKPYTSNVGTTIKMGAYSNEGASLDKFRAFAIIEDGVALADYVPCVNLSNNIAGMWDFSSGAFKPSSNDHPYSAGPII